MAPAPESGGMFGSRGGFNQRGATDFVGMDQRGGVGGGGALSMMPQPMREVGHTTSDIFSRRPAARSVKIFIIGHQHSPM